MSGGVVGAGELGDVAVGREEYVELGPHEVHLARERGAEVQRFGSRRAEGCAR